VVRPIAAAANNVRYRTLVHITTNGARGFGVKLLTLDRGSSAVSLIQAAGPA
jgi:hypothetical protein